MNPSNTMTLLAAISTLVFALPAVSISSPPKETIDPFSGKACYLCHQSRVSGANIHSALMENRCTPCHKLSNGNHQANHSFSEVKDRTARLCYECHDDQSRQKSVHPPVMDKNCLGCHAPHVSAHRNLLKSPLSRLCFECHDQALLNEEETVKSTDFRDGNRNLHYLHARKNALPCLSCHQPHAGSQEHLLITKTGSGKEQVTLTYKATRTGGSCTTSCHDTIDYLRK